MPSAVTSASRGAADRLALQRPAMGPRAMAHRHRGPERAGPAARRGAADDPAPEQRRACGRRSGASRRHQGQAGPAQALAREPWHTAPMAGERKSPAASREATDQQRSGDRRPSGRRFRCIAPAPGRAHAAGLARRHRPTCGGTAPRTAPGRASHQRQETDSPPAGLQGRAAPGAPGTTRDRAQGACSRPRAVEHRVGGRSGWGRWPVAGDAGRAAGGGGFRRVARRAGVTRGSRRG